jgi:hypothetical protein
VTPDPARQWLEAFAARVRARDLDGGRALFDPRCTGYGTRAAEAIGIEALVAQQWSLIWPSTVGFAFDTDTIRTVGEPAGGVVVAMARWSSTAVTDTGQTIERTGRATIVLQPSTEAPHGLVAVHTHFSETPDRSDVDGAGRPVAGADR